MGDTARATPAGLISLVPADSPSRWCWSGRGDSLHIYLKPGLVTRREHLGASPTRHDQVWVGRNQLRPVSDKLAYHAVLMHVCNHGIQGWDLSRSLDQGLA